MAIKKLTPNLYTDDVESCVKFWVERMHFEKTVEVPDEGGLAFAAIEKGGIELMYGKWANLDKEPGVAGSYQRGTGFLFIEVDDLEAVLVAMADVPMVMPVHKTLYGATEFAVKDPAGHLITFAHFAAQ
jgi:uncharacterized glyoxalase superfamily protein PhnB